MARSATAGIRFQGSVSIRTADTPGGQRVIIDPGAPNLTRVGTIAHNERMRQASALLLSLLLAAPVVAAQKSAPPPKPEPVAQPKPTPRAPSPASRPATPARGGIAMLVTDPRGATLPGVEVEFSGPTARRETTDANGRVNRTDLLAGTYRLRFSGDGIVTFEREVEVERNQVATLDVTLNPAPALPEPPAPIVVAQAPAAGPTGEPRTLGIVDLLEDEFVGRDARRESLLSCSGNERATMIQLNEPMPDRLYDNADVVYYVLGGSGTLTIGGRDTRIETNGFISIPRGTLHGFERRGNRPLVLLAVLSGAPCEEAR